MPHVRVSGIGRVGLRYQNRKMIIRWLLAAAAIVLIILGVAGDEPAAVLDKAIHICLECIGIG